MVSLRDLCDLLCKCFFDVSLGLAEKSYFTEDRKGHEDKPWIQGPAPGTTSRQAQRSDGSQRWLSLCDLCDLLLQIPWCLACQIPGQPTASLRSARCPKCSLGRLTVIPLKEFFRRRPSLQPRVPCQLLSEKTSDPKGSRTLPFAPLRPSQKGCLDQRQPASVSPPQLDS
jgi:hypothetical protein